MSSDVHTLKLVWCMQQNAILVKSIFCEVSQHMKHTLGKVCRNLYPFPPLLIPRFYPLSFLLNTTLPPCFSFYPPSLPCFVHPLSLPPPLPPSLPKIICVPAELQPAAIDKMLKPCPPFEGLRLEGENIHRGQGNFKVNRY